MKSEISIIKIQTSCNEFYVYPNSSFHVLLLVSKCKQKTRYFVSHANYQLHILNYNYTMQSLLLCFTRDLVSCWDPYSANLFMIFFVKNKRSTQGLKMGVKYEVKIDFAENLFYRFKFKVFVPDFHISSISVKA